MVSDKVPGDKWPVFAEGLESFSPVCTQRGPLSTGLRATNRAEQTLGVTSSSHLWGLGKAGPFVRMSDKRAAGSRPPLPTQPDPLRLLEKDTLGAGDRAEVCGAHPLLPAQTNVDSSWAGRGPIMGPPPKSG